MAKKYMELLQTRASLRDELAALHDRVKNGKATAEDDATANSIEAKILRVSAEIDREESRFNDGRPLPPARMPGGPSGWGGGPRVSIGDGGPYALRGPHDPKGYADLFGSEDGYKWQDKTTSFFGAVLSGRHHPDLNPKGMTEGVGSDGGFLVPTEYAERIHTVSLESEIVAPRAFLQPMKSNELKLPAMTIGSHFASIYGGFKASYTGEAGTINENDPTTRSMTLVAKKLTGLIRFSNELAQDIPGGENQLVQLCGKGLGFFRDRAFLKGSGAGEPLGVLNANCTIEVTPEVGQLDGTILYENLAKMFSRLHPASMANAVWICNGSAIPQLLGLTIGTGTGGVHFPVLKENSGTFSIFGKECVFTEKVPSVGQRGDVILADLSQYVVGLRAGMRFDTSAHVHFVTDELMARLIERHDGMPLWDQPLTQEDGATTVSPFVVLAARA